MIEPWLCAKWSTVVFVHGLGGHARGTWTYEGSHRDPVSSVLKGEDRPSFPGDGQGANVTGAADTHPTTTAKVAEHSDAQSAQESHANLTEAARKSLWKRLHTSSFCTLDL